MPYHTETWLLHKPVFFDKGLPIHNGGIVGGLSPSGEMGYVYPEIGGYYLSFLAEIVTRQNANSILATQRINSTLDWLDAVSVNRAMPMGRYPLPGAAEDWRAHTSFLFDIGIILRGLCAVYYTGIANHRFSTLYARYASYLAHFTRTPEGLVAHKATTQNAPPVPNRWSTNVGGYLCKALSFEAIRPLKLGGATTIDSTATWLGQLRRIMPTPLADMSHPLLYHIEGLFILGSALTKPEYLNEGRKLLYSLIARAWPKRALPEYLNLPDSIVRSDVQAQLLRALVIANGLGIMTEVPPREIELFAEYVKSFISKDGAVPFSLPSDNPTEVHYNTWCTMFVHQALSWFDYYRRYNRLPENWPVWLI